MLILIKTRNNVMSSNFFFFTYIISYALIHFIIFECTDRSDFNLGNSEIIEPTLTYVGVYKT